MATCMPIQTIKIASTVIGLTFIALCVVGWLLLTTGKLSYLPNEVSSLQYLLNTTPEKNGLTYVKMPNKTTDHAEKKPPTPVAAMTASQQSIIATLSSKDKWMQWMANITKTEAYRHYKKINGSELFKPRYPGDDRIVDMLRYVPDGYSGATAEKKLILTWTTYIWQDPNFTGCVVNSCSVTTDRRKLHEADAVIFHNLNEKNMPMRDGAIPQSQVWVIGQLESPYNSKVSSSRTHFNWTSTYRLDSTLPLVYGKVFLYNQSVKTLPQGVNYAAGKTKKIALFMSNCQTVTNGRLAYARELQKHIQVDIYGACGKLRCPRTKEDTCFQYLKKDYKFYLAFENSNCRDYMTEKLFRNALQYDVIPIVMGAHPDDYKRAAPHHSYIHVDDFDSPRHLAQYLHLLDQNDDLYNQYFQWKGTAEVVGRPWFMKWCKLCALLHAPRPTIVQRDLATWWNGKGICIGKDSWRKHGYTPSRDVPPLASIQLKDI